jgi:uncharacterized membrane protein YedE/YeeE
VAFLDEVMTARITAEAKQIHPGRALLTLIAAVFFGVGWVLAKLCRITWFVVAWSVAAVKVGWQEGRKPARRSP